MKKSYLERWGHERTKKARGRSERDRRRVEAKERERQWENLSTYEKTIILLTRPGRCERQLTRLGYSLV